MSPTVTSAHRLSAAWPAAAFSAACVAMLAAAPMPLSERVPAVAASGVLFFLTRDLSPLALCMAWAGLGICVAGFGLGNVASSAANSALLTDADAGYLLVLMGGALAIAGIALGLFSTGDTALPPRETRDSAA